VGDSAGDSESVPEGNRHHPPRRIIQSLLARPALRVLQLRLAHLHLLALRLADDKRAAADVLGFIQLVLLLLSYFSQLEFSVSIFKVSL
jgi:hypothetical protein